MIGYGMRGESQRTNTNVETQVVIPWRIAVRSALSKDTIWVASYLIAWAIWTTLVGNNAEIGWRCGNFCAWWTRFRAGGEVWLIHMSRWGLLYFVPLLAMWWEPMQKVWIGTYHPRLLNPNHPPEAAQYDPTTFHPHYGRIGADTRDVPDREELRIRIEDHTTTETAYPDRDMCDLFSPAGHPGNLARYVAALIRGNETSAAFSFAGGNDHHGASHWRYTRAEFGELSTEAARAGLVYREKKNQPYEITERGRFTFGRIAERGLDHSSHSPAPSAQS